MSRIAKKPIPIPSGVSVTIAGGNVSVKGPLGELTRPYHPDIAVSVADGAIVIAPHVEGKRTKALLGTTAAHIKNMLGGVKKVYEKRLLIEGVGYRWEAAGDKIKLSLGFSHPVFLDIPHSIKVAIEKGALVISGINKDTVAQFAANIRALKEPEPYKGKGIRYEGEIVRRKQGKKTV